MVPTGNFLDIPRLMNSFANTFFYTCFMLYTIVSITFYTLFIPSSPKSFAPLTLFWWITQSFILCSLSGTPTSLAKPC